MMVQVEKFASQCAVCVVCALKGKKWKSESVCSLGIVTCKWRQGAFWQFLNYIQISSPRDRRNSWNIIYHLRRELAFIPVWNSLTREFEPFFRKFGPLRELFAKKACMHIVCRWEMLRCRCCRKGYPSDAGLPAGSPSSLHTGFRVRCITNTFTLLLFMSLKVLLSYIVCSRAGKKYWD